MFGCGVTVFQFSFLIVGKLDIVFRSEHGHCGSEVDACASRYAQLQRIVVILLSSPALLYHSKRLSFRNDDCSAPTRVLLRSKHDKLKRNGDLAYSLITYRQSDPPYGALYCNVYFGMDMPVNVPVDNPNADTEWYARRKSTVIYN